MRHSKHQYDAHQQVAEWSPLKRTPAPQQTNLQGRQWFFDKLDRNELPA